MPDARSHQKSEVGEADATIRPFAGPPWAPNAIPRWLRVSAWGAPRQALKEGGRRQNATVAMVGRLPQLYRLAPAVRHPPASVIGGFKDQGEPKGDEGGELLVF